MRTWSIHLVHCTRKAASGPPHSTTLRAGEDMFRSGKRELSETARSHASELSRVSLRSAGRRFEDRGSDGSERGGLGIPPVTTADAATDRRSTAARAVCGDGAESGWCDTAGGWGWWREGIRCGWVVGECPGEVGLFQVRSSTSRLPRISAILVGKYFPAFWVILDLKGFPLRRSFLNPSLILSDL